MAYLSPSKFCSFSNPNMKKGITPLFIFHFQLLPFCLVLFWIFYLLFFSNTSQTSQPNQKKPRLPEKISNGPTFDPGKEFIIKTRKINSSGTFFIKRSINLSQTVVYADMWRSHWCTYYNDREFFFTPRINEMLQRFRQLSVPVVQISMSVDAFNGNTKQRQEGRKVVAKGALDVLEKYNAQAARYHKDYIPGFADTCVYTDQERFGKYRDNRFSKQIAIAEDDYFVQNFKESAESFVGLGAKHVIILGQHTNMCLMAVFLYCQQVGLDLIIVRDLVDACWLYKYQKKHVKNHTAGNVAVNDYFDKVIGSSVLSYDLIRSIKRYKAERKQPVYNMFTNVAHMFKYL